MSISGTSYQNLSPDSSQIVAAHGMHEITSFDIHFSAIECHYEGFLATNQSSDCSLSEAGFETCVSKLEEMRKVYETLYRSDRPNANKVKEKLDSAQEMVQTMNKHFNTLTRHDVDGALSFFKKPIEEEYTDKTSGVQYIQPDHSSLLRFGGKFFIEGGYEAVGLLRHYKIKDSLCDVLYLKKRDDQIRFERCHIEYINYLVGYHIKGDTSSSQPPKIMHKTMWSGRYSLRDRTGEDIVESMGTQFSLIKKSAPILEDRCKEWKYDKYELCAHAELGKLGFDKNVSESNHLILFYYKKNQ